MRLWEYTPDPFRALVSSFFARFFESEVTTSIDDLKGTFFWLLAALAVPGIFIPWMMVFDWQGIVAMKGPIALREASQAEKTFYLGFTMIASGLLTAIVWSSLLPDRRDALILGTLPVGSPTIVTAKLTALGGYILLVAVAMHAIGSIFFGAILSTKSSGWFALRGILAHFIASSAASGGVALMVAAAQGLTLALGGPRLFRRMSAVLQVCLVGVMAMGLAYLPIIASSIVHSVRGFGSRMQPWILSTPPAWFLGLYEWVLGTSDPVLLGLARTAALTVLAGLVVTVATYPFAYRRLMVTAVEFGAGPARFSVGRFIRGLLVRAAGRHPEARAAADFYTATIARVERHRFVMAMALGMAFAWMLTGWLALDPRENDASAWLSLPISLMVFLMVGLRLSAALPGDVRASWVFEVKTPSRRYARQALERMLFLLAVIPPSLLAAPVFWSVWGGTFALTHLAVSLALGLAVVELLLWHSDGIPCAQRWSLAGGRLRYRAPGYLFAFVVITVGIPKLEVLLFPHVYLAATFIGMLIVLAVATRHASVRHVIVPSYEDVDPVAGVLRLG